MYNGGIQTKLDKIVSALPSGSATTCAGDVSKAEDATRMVEATVKFGGRIDVLVNNTGRIYGGIVAKLDPKLWREVIEVNLTGPFLLTKAAISFMIENGGGSILNIADLGGLRCHSGMPAYASSKAGLIILTQQVAMDYGPHTVINNVVCPGGTRTPMTERSLGRLKKTLNTDLDGVFKVISFGLPLRRFAAPEEITGICSYLASDDSSFMTGSVLVIEGGAAVVDVSGASLAAAGVKWGGV